MSHTIGLCMARNLVRRMKHGLRKGFSADTDTNGFWKATIGARVSYSVFCIPRSNSHWYIDQRHQRFQLASISSDNLII
jgi:hypothetical protein